MAASKSVALFFSLLHPRSGLSFFIGAAKGRRIPTLRAMMDIDGWIPGLSDRADVIDVPTTTGALMSRVRRKPI